jgi:hypothetical protein
MARRHIEPFVDRDVPFKRMTLPGFRRGMNYKMLSIDKDTGACTMTVQLEGGYKQPPSISMSDLEILSMKGTFMLGDQTCTPGYYTFIPRGVSIPTTGSRTSSSRIRTRPGRSARDSSPPIPTTTCPGRSPISSRRPSQGA